MRTKPCFWIGLVASAVTMGWLLLKPAGSPKHERAQRPRTLNRLYMVTAIAESTNAPPSAH